MYIVSLISETLSTQEHYFAEPPTCTEEEYRCSNGQCVNWTQRCDLQFDCWDKSDELHCGEFCDASFYPKEGTGYIRCIFKAQDFEVRFFIMYFLSTLHPFHII
jgi:hypothetical protein